MASVTASTFDGRAAGRGGLLAAGLGAGLLGLGLAVNPARTLHAYLVAYAFAISTVIGALIFLLIGHAINAHWVAPLRRLNEMVASAVVPLAVLFVPLALGLEVLYPWVSPQPELGHHTLELIRKKRSYLNVPFFLARTALYFLIWVGVTFCLRRWSLQRDRAHANACGPHRGSNSDKAFSRVALIPVAFTTTFSAFDWLMSLQPAWYSTMFGVYYFAGGFVAAFALLAIMAERIRERTQGAVHGAHFHALGRLLFAFLAFWAYCAFFQAMLIALADKPVEVIFYTERLRGSWAAFPWLFCLGHFALPFALLLSRQAKHRSGHVAVVSGWILLMHLAEIYWLVMPLLSRERATPHFQELGALGLVIGTCVAFVAFSHHGRPLVPLGDPKLARGVAYRGAS